MDETLLQNIVDVVQDERWNNLEIDLSTTDRDQMFSFSKVDNQPGFMVIRYNLKVARTEVFLSRKQFLNRVKYYFKIY